MGHIKYWVEAARLRTLPLAFSCILMGGFLAKLNKSLDWLVLFLSLLTTLLLQVLSNFANDYGDSISGIDGNKRIGPARTIQSGKISKANMRRAMILMSTLAVTSGLFLLLYACRDHILSLLLFLILGLFAVAAAILYTVGKEPYGYLGFGDLFVFVFFGLVGVGGGYYLHALEFDWKILLPSASCGLFAVGVLNVNNIRDIESDSAYGKFSVPVRIGKAKAKFYHLFLLLSGWASILCYAFLYDFPMGGYIFTLTIPLFIINTSAIFRKSSHELDPYLKQLAISVLLFVLLFGLGTISYS